MSPRFFKEKSLTAAPEAAQNLVCAKGAQFGKNYAA